MVADDGAAASHDLTYAEALAALRDSLRFTEFQVAFTALGDQVIAAWQEVEPAIRLWVDQAARLTEQQWIDEPESTRAFYETWRQWFAEHDGRRAKERRELMATDDDDTQAGNDAAAAAQPVGGLETLDELDEQASERIRSVLHDGRLFFSVVDVVGLLTDSPRPRNYWVDLKRRLADDEGFSEVHAKCVQLKLPAADGKQRLTDCADTETMLRIVQSIPSPKAEPLKQWLARVGSERLDEIEAPERAADRMRQLYRQRGYTDEWIRARLQSIVTRDELTEEWRERGATEGKEFAVLTEILHTGTFDLSTDEHKGIKALKKRDNLRDNMTPLELALTILSEATATALHQEHDSQGMGELSDDARRAGRVGGTARRDVEAELGRPVVSAENAKTLTARATQPELLSADDQDDQQRQR